MFHGIGSKLATAVAVLLVLLGTDAAGAAGRARGTPAPPAGDQTILVMSGVIGPGSYQAFRRIVARSRPDLVVLQGPGGILREAIRIGNEIRARGLGTAVGAHSSCASACAVVFLSGQTKYLGNHAAVGLHMARYADGRRSPVGTEIMAQYLSRVGVPDRILARMSRTAPDDIAWLSRADQKALNIRSF